MSPVTINITPRYSETDQMGIIHHANYLIYLEQARLEWLSQLGFSYVKMEEEGVLLPVYNIDIKYKNPIKFGEEIYVRISLQSKPTTRVVFDYEIVNQKNQICAVCELTLVFTDAQTFRPRKPIPEFLEACSKLF
ncbi:acyl-CoA thioesterase [Nonlabens sp. Ci31]|jgi:acyl-CoA thioester hydrolase|uniref:acyl-CoA thioesterase n=1 Tax=Nonlabens sp. Ci31 TaxID=2608253 RepID=UPI001463A87D|nr:thioesterase family protein [Nonlabens sp. Ci31]QJP35845.1 acyl-CoA thioesterase [Nonlabens sp. Ci31]